MSAPTTWTLVTGQGTLDWGEWVSTEVVSMFVLIDDGSKAQFGTGDPPRKVYRAGWLGLGQFGDPDPFDSTAIMGVSLWWPLEWEYTEIRGYDNWPMSLSASMWNLYPGVSLYYKINGV